MGPELSDESISQICMFMRVTELMKNNPQILEDSPEMRAQYEKISVMLSKMLDLLTDEQRDMVLEEHIRQLEQLKEEEEQQNQGGD